MRRRVATRMLLLKKIAPRGRRGRRAARDARRLVKANRHRGRADLVLKCDIESAEWEMLATLDPALLRRFRQFVVEVHGLRDLTLRASRRSRTRRCGGSRRPTARSTSTATTTPATPSSATCRSPPCSISPSCAPTPSPSCARADPSRPFCGERAAPALVPRARRELTCHGLRLCYLDDPEAAIEPGRCARDAGPSRSRPSSAGIRRFTCRRPPPRNRPHSEKTPED